MVDKYKKRMSEEEFVRRYGHKPRLVIDTFFLNQSDKAYDARDVIMGIPPKRQKFYWSGMLVGCLLAFLVEKLCIDYLYIKESLLFHFLLLFVGVTIGGYGGEMVAEIWYKHRRNE